MTFLKNTFAALAISLVCAPAAHASSDDASGIRNPMTQAMLGAYEQMLKEDPKDYETYLNRANEYYRYGEYIRALDDVNKALEFTPASNTQMRFLELSLRAAIYQQSNKPELALADMQNAVALDPQSFTAIYQKANLEYELNKYAAAKADYQQMLRMNSRSMEALIGLARVAVKESNLGLANDYLDQAVQIDPNNLEAYLRRSNVRKSMGNDNGAVDDIILALSIDSENPRAIESIVDYANTNYSAVMSGLSNAISQAPKVGLYRYLRAVIAQAHYHYTAALSDFDVIIKDYLYDYHGIYASIATCRYYLGQFSQALNDIDTALNNVSDIAQYFILRARILRAMDRLDEAVDAAAKATAASHNSPESLVELGLCYISKKDYEQAVSLIGEATLTNNETPYYYMLRAWVLEGFLNQPVAAKQFYGHVIGMDNLAEFNVKSLRGFAMLFRGDKEDATKWIEQVMLNNPDYDGLASYYAACLYTQMGDSDKALEYVEKSLEKGYGNYYDWMYNTDARINVAPLRDDLRFLHLLHKHNLLFDRD